MSEMAQGPFNQILALPLAELSTLWVLSNEIMKLDINLAIKIMFQSYRQTGKSHRRIGQHTIRCQITIYY